MKPAHDKQLVTTTESPTESPITDRLLRVRQIVPGILPMSRSTFLEKVRQGVFPRPVKIGERITAWRESEIMKIVRGEG